MDEHDAVPSARSAATRVLSGGAGFHTPSPDAARPGDNLP
jgi:hypothetical protein